MGTERAEQPCSLWLETIYATLLEPKLAYVEMISGCFWWVLSSFLNLAMPRVLVVFVDVGDGRR
jgi:hypothetical protein